MTQGHPSLQTCHAVRVVGSSTVHDLSTTASASSATARPRASRSPSVRRRTRLPRRPRRRHGSSAFGRSSVGSQTITDWDATAVLRADPPGPTTTAPPIKNEAPPQGGQVHQIHAGRRRQRHGRGDRRVVREAPQDRRTRERRRRRRLTPALREVPPRAELVDEPRQLGAARGARVRHVRAPLRPKRLARRNARETSAASTSGACLSRVDFRLATINRHRRSARADATSRAS